MKSAHIARHIDPPADWGILPWGEQGRVALEQQLLPWWPRLFGFHLLKIGQLSSQIDSSSCPIAHQVNVGPESATMQVIADVYQLPFAAKSIDACLLAHTLGYTQDPHRLLREVDRVLIDDGWLVLSGFNPFSLYGAAKLLPIVRRKPAYASRVFSQMRLLDWLNLLNYEILYQTRFQVLPWQQGGGHFISAHLPVQGLPNFQGARGT